MMNKYLESVQFIESLINNPGPNFLKENSKKDRSFFIKRIKYLLNLIGNPEKNFKYIHIAGTSGKSSLTCMLQSILTRAGVKTGAYFSPHPTEIYERIKVNNKYISKICFTELINRLKPYLSRCALKSPYGIPSYFETLFALALLYFKKQKCEYVVLETGLGGTFDATNVIPKPEIAVITNVNLDHTDILGKTKEKIAINKAGIIKKGSTLITAEQDTKTLKIFKKICKQKKCEFHKADLNYKIIKNDLSGVKFEYQNQTYQTRLLGEHQIKNAILAIKAMQGISHKKSVIKDGLDNAFLSCRIEVIQKNPTIILDGAHNPDKMKTTAEFIKNIKHNRLHLIIALAENKDLYNTLKYIVPMASHMYLTRFLIPNRKNQNLKKMCHVCKKLTKNRVEVYIAPEQALANALHKAKKNDIILITGSFFLAGELRKKWISF